MRLAGKRAFITGAASGFGAEMARRFAAEGARVALADLNAAGADAVAREIGEAACAFACDVAKADAVEAAIAGAAEALGGLDTIVNNAGATHPNQPMETVAEAEFDRVMAVNLKSIYLTTRAALPILRKVGGGVILNIGSTAGVRPRPGLAWYNASKGAVNLVSKSMAVELAPDKIRVNCIAPVAGETPLLAAFMGEDTPEMRAKFIASIPWGRFSTPADIAAAAVFLASGEADMVTGAVLEVDGGRCV